MSIDAISVPFNAYQHGGLMILGESAYPYDEYGDGTMYGPKGEDHCVNHI